jgi:hypothetical protein
MEFNKARSSEGSLSLRRGNERPSIFPMKNGKGNPGNLFEDRWQHI